jgi:hypothetical protein
VSAALRLVYAAGQQVDDLRPEPTQADYDSLFHTAAMTPLASGRWRLTAEERGYAATLLDATPDAVTQAAAWVAALSGSPAAAERRQAA